MCDSLSNSEQPSGACAQTHTHTPFTYYKRMLSFVCMPYVSSVCVCVCYSGCQGNPGWKDSLTSRLASWDTAVTWRCCHHGDNLRGDYLNKDTQTHTCSHIPTWQAEHTLQTSPTEPNTPVLILISANLYVDWKFFLKEIVRPPTRRGQNVLSLFFTMVCWPENHEATSGEHLPRFCQWKVPDDHLCMDGFSSEPIMLDPLGWVRERCWSLFCVVYFRRYL